MSRGPEPQLSSNVDAAVAVPQLQATPVSKVPQLQAASLGASAAGNISPSAPLSVEVEVQQLAPSAREACASACAAQSAAGVVAPLSVHVRAEQRHALESPVSVSQRQQLAPSVAAPSSVPQQLLVRSDDVYVSSLSLSQAVDPGVHQDQLQASAADVFVSSGSADEHFAAVVQQQHKYAADAHLFTSAPQPVIGLIAQQQQSKGPTMLPRPNNISAISLPLPGSSEATEVGNLAGMPLWSSRISDPGKASTSPQQQGQREAEVYSPHPLLGIRLPGLSVPLLYRPITPLPACKAVGTSGSREGQVLAGGECSDESGPIGCLVTKAIRGLSSSIRLMLKNMRQVYRWVVQA